MTTIKNEIKMKPNKKIEFTHITELQNENFPKKTSENNAVCVSDIF